MNHTVQKINARMRATGTISCKCGARMHPERLARHKYEDCDLEDIPCSFMTLFGHCVPTCTGTVTVRTAISHLGTMETFVQAVFDQHIELMAEVSFAVFVSK